MKRKKHNQRQEDGFTLLEVVLGAALSVVVAFVAVSFYFSYSKKLDNMSEELEVSGDVESGQRILLKDMKALDPCFGQCVVQADGGMSGTFFDYYPDLPEEALVAAGMGGRREIVLSASSSTKEAAFLLLDLSADPLPTLLYQPSAAYNIGPTPTSFYDAATLAFVSLNRNNWVSSQRPGFPNPGPAGGYSGGYWRQGQLLMLDTPVGFRLASEVNNANYRLLSPRAPAFVGMVNGTALEVTSELKARLNYTHPVTGVEITSVDDFLKRLPAMAGGQPLVRLRPVRLVKYSLEPISTKPGEKLMKLKKSVYAGAAGYKKSFQIADKIMRVSFSRSSLTDKAVYFDLSRE